MLIYLSLLETDAEKEAFLALYSQYHQAMLRLARRYFPTDQMSLEDAVQNAWVKIIRNFPKIRTLEGKNRGAYCVITVKNECISLLRKRSREIPTEELETLLPQHDSQAGAAAIVALIRDMPCWKCGSWRSAPPARSPRRCTCRRPRSTPVSSGAASCWQSA